jgi:hypothetical protein
MMRRGMTGMRNFPGMNLKRVDSRTDLVVLVGVVCPARPEALTERLRRFVVPGTRQIRGDEIAGVPWRKLISNVAA